MRSLRFRFPRLASCIALFGIASLVMTACGGVQSDPPGQNSGSPEYAQGTFNFDDPNAINGSVGQTVNVYDTFTSVTVTFTVNTVATSTAPANQNSGENTLPPGEQYLVVNMTLVNTSGTGNTGCPSYNVSKCTEYLSPLQNFRMLDSSGRSWPSTTGAAEACSTDPHTPCANRDWLTLLGESSTTGVVPPGQTRGGLTPGMSFTNQIVFLISTDPSLSYTLYFAPYRYMDSPLAAGGSPSGKSLPTLAKIAITP